MTTTYTALLEAAKTAYLTCLQGVSVEWSEGGKKVRVSDPDKMLSVIERLEVLAAEEAGAGIFRPIVSVNP